VKKQFKMSIHLGASHDEVTIDGVAFDRSKMKGEEKSKLRRLVTAAFAEASGVRWGVMHIPSYMRNETAKQQAARNAPAFRRSSRQRPADAQVAA
jgi:hypothetical protein